MRKVARERYDQLRKEVVRSGGSRVTHLELSRRLYGEGPHQCTAHLEFLIVPDDRQMASTVKHRERLSYRVRCRKCDACRRARAALWRTRAQVEALAARQSWMATFTLNDDHLYVMEEQARLRLERRSGDPLPNERTSKRYFMEVEHQGYVALVKMWKRLRKRGFHIRYFLVAEPHDSDKTADYRRGVPHWHALVSSHDDGTECAHPPEEGRPHVCPVHCACRCLPCTLRREWPAGFADFKAIGSSATDLLKAAAYVAKYLSKLMLARVRSSQHYGRDTNILCLDTESVSTYSPPPEDVMTIPTVSTRPTDPPLLDDNTRSVSVTDLKIDDDA